MSDTLEISRVSVDLLPDIVHMHMQIFDGYFLKNLGQQILWDYYNEFLINEDSIFLAAKTDEHIVGFVLLTSKYKDTLHRFYKKNGFKVARKILCEVCKNNNIIIDGLKIRISRFLNLFKSKPTETFKEDSTVLLSIGVVKTYRGKNISLELVMRAEETLKTRGVLQYGLSVKNDNIGAKKFYHKMGFHIVSQNNELDYYSKTV